MAALKRSFCFFYLLLHLGFLLPHAVNCDDNEDLLKAINEYRTESLHLSQLKENSAANCIATEIARNLSHKNCDSSNSATASSAAQRHELLTDKNLGDCHVLKNSTTEGVIMPVCMETQEPMELVLANYTGNQEYSKYLNSSKYEGAGFRCKGKWKVVLLTTNTTGGRFIASGAAASLLVSKVRFGWHSLSFLSLSLLQLLAA